MSNATAISDHDIEKRTLRRHRPYLQPLKAVEAQVAILQQELKVQRQQHHDAIERNLVLAELNYTQERLQAIYNKHVQWLQCSDTAEQSFAVSSSAPDGLPLDGSNAAEPWAVQDARWVMFCLETASKEQVQQALTMTSADWSTFQRQLCEDLIGLMEIDKRSPEVQVRAELRVDSRASNPARECSQWTNYYSLTSTVVQWQLGMLVQGHKWFLVKHAQKPQQDS
jgi:acetolactate synthase small subunit